MAPVEIGAEEGLSVGLRERKNQAAGEKAAKCLPQFAIGEKGQVGRGCIEAAACRQIGPELINDSLGALVFEKFHAARARGGWRRSFVAGNQRQKAICVVKERWSGAAAAAGGWRYPG
jgi:hypothetical protein